MTAVHEAPAAMTTTDGPLLAVAGLCVEFATAEGWLPVVEDVGFTVARGETLGLVGESGCGKTVSALAVMGLIPARSGRVPAGTVRFEGCDEEGELVQTGTAAIADKPRRTG